MVRAHCLITRMLQEEEYTCARSNVVMVFDVNCK